MNINRLYVLSKEQQAGGLVVSMGLMEILKRHFQNVAFFRPIVDDKDRIDADIKTMLDCFDLKERYEDAAGVCLDDVESFLAKGEKEKLFEKMIEKFEVLQSKYDFVLCEGLSDPRLTALVDFDINCEIAKNLSTPIAGVISAQNQDIKDIEETVALWQRGLEHDGLKILSFFINRINKKVVKDLQKSKICAKYPCYFIPYNEELGSVTVLDVVDQMHGIFCIAQDEKRLEVMIKKPIIAAMRVENFLERFDDGDMVIVPADRSDILLAVQSANSAAGFACASAIVIGGNLEADEKVTALMQADENFHIPLIKVPLDTMQIAAAINKVEAKITPRHKSKIALLMGHFAQYVRADEITARLAKVKSDILTPAMFSHKIFAQAQKDIKMVVLPESQDERILRAAQMVMMRKIAKIVMIGKKDDILHRANLLGINLQEIIFVDMDDDDLKDRFAKKFYELRKEKGVTLESAAETMQNATYFATMMVKEEMADAMVCGATHTTRDTVLPALQIIKTAPGIDIVSSVFFMCLDTRVLVYGDCAINPDPNAEELAQIAISSAKTSEDFGIDPKIAMLSYSSGKSGIGTDVDKVSQATQIARHMRPDLSIEGPIQYDAAIDPGVAKLKMPKSLVAGRANVFIFPDLDSGNMTYKAVQRSTGAIAIGPVLQGLNKPVNDLSRGASVEDIVNTIAITAIQAQKVKQ